MKNLFKNLVYVSLMFITVVSCDTFETELEVENLENPNDDILTSDPVALEATAAGLFNAIYMSIETYYGPGMALNTMADVSTCSWGNVGMRDLSSEPRVAWNNGVAYGNGFITNDFFNALYSSLSDANTLALAVSNGTEFDDTNLINAVAKFGQAITIGYNALIFNKVWLSDETGVVGDAAADYNAAMTFALTKLDQAIAIANANSFTVPNSWFNAGGDLSSSELSQIMSSFGARMLAGNARNSTERAAVNWSKVLAYANAGITTDYDIQHDDTVWYDYFKTYLVYPGWARIDLRTISLMDPAYPSYWPAGATVLPEATSVDARLATDYDYLSGQNFRPERGEYHYSSYRYGRYDTYIAEWVYPTVWIPAAEIQLYAAEAKLWAGDAAGAAAIVNAGTRVTRGNLAPVAANAADVLAAIHYERIVEMPLAAAGISFFEMRSTNRLQAGTLLHFPVPGKALESIPADNYTYGGTDGTAGVDYSSGGWR